MVRYHRTNEMLEAAIGDELVALNVTAGTCFGFNSVATCVWQLLERDRSFDELHAELMNRYDVRDDECSLELRNLIEKLLEMHLIGVAA